MTGKYAIVVKDLVKKFGDIVAVNHIDFKVEYGEIFGFLGPNGAGKTTTINILVTLMKPSSGEAYVGGYNVIENPIKVRELIGIVFQDNTVDRNLTGWENLYIHGLIYGLKGGELEKRIENALEFVELKKFGNEVVKNYSGGMIRRLEIARALLHRPKILFLDEPTLGLDPQTRAKIWDYISSLREEFNVTIFLTTHYMDEADRLCDRVAIIDHGKIVAMDTPENLKSSIGNDIVYVKIIDSSIAKPDIFNQIVDGKKIYSHKKVGDNMYAFSTLNASEAIPQIFEKMSKYGVKISEVRYTKPTLGDVFLHYTGRELREERGDWKEFMRMRMRAR